MTREIEQMEWKKEEGETRTLETDKPAPITQGSDTERRPAEDT
jgi:hypothetical protein